MNLRQGEGKVPVFTGGIKPFKLVPFPTREEFNDLYKNISQNCIGLSSRPGQGEPCWPMPGNHLG